MDITAAVLSGFLVAAVAPFLNRVAGKWTGWLLPLFPLGLAIYFSVFVGRVTSQEVIAAQVAWAPSLDLSLSFYVDGLSLIFALLISGIGALIVLYASYYLHDHPHLGRFYAIILMFMASMLGLTLAGNLISLFLFWELTSISSYLLVGFDHHREQAREAALQALLVTGGGGLALLAGLLLLGHAGGTFSIPELLTRGEAIREHPLATPILLLILVGAFTKSAQTPFHFWLPNAMQAPTPVSAYLHSATMVKAGVYLLARLSPVFSETELWQYLVTAVGATTMLVGALMALGQTDLKRILAYTTVSKLGILVMLLGIGTELAVKAAIVVLLAHALYKAALFMIAGTIDHESGARDITRLGGLRRAMPITAATAGLAAASMAAVPPLIGFIGKEKFYEASLHAERAPLLLITAATLGSALVVTSAVVVAVKPFFGQVAHTPKHPHEAPWQLWLGPAILAGAGLALGLLPGVALASLVSAGASSVLGETVTLKLRLWTGFNIVLLLTGVTLALGLMLYWRREAALRAARPLRALARWGPEYCYDRLLQGMLKLADLQTLQLQSGYLRHYVITITLSTVGLVGVTFLLKGTLPWPDGSADIRFHEAGVAALVLAAAVAAALTRSRLAGAIALGVAGYGVATIFIFFGAPDLAMTQILIETLTVVLFLLVFYHLPPPVRLSGLRTRLRDGLIAAGAGGLMTLLVLVAAGAQFHPPIAGFFAANSVPMAHGRNIVNVILVDFRALDTLGEITVLAIAAIGVFALLKLAGPGLLPGSRAPERSPASPLPADASNPGIEAAPPGQDPATASGGQAVAVSLERRVEGSEAEEGEGEPVYSLMLATATRFLITLLLLLPLFLLLRGHNEPGGGFVAGLVAATAVSLYAVAYDVNAARRALRFDPRMFLGVGILIALGSGAISLLKGQPFLTGQWGVIDLPGFTEFSLGTPLLFDLGVFIAVLGVTLTIIFALMEE